MRVFVFVFVRPSIRAPCNRASVRYSDAHASCSARLDRVLSCVPGPLYVCVRCIRCVPFATSCVCVRVCACVCIGRVLTARTPWYLLMQMVFFMSKYLRIIRYLYLREGPFHKDICKHTPPEWPICTKPGGDERTGEKMPWVRLLMGTGGKSQDIMTDTRALTWWKTTIKKEYMSIDLDVYNEVKSQTYGSKAIPMRSGQGWEDLIKKLKVLMFVCVCVGSRVLCSSMCSCACSVCTLLIVGGWIVDRVHRRHATRTCLVAAGTLLID